MKKSVPIMTGISAITGSVGGEEEDRSGLLSQHADAALCHSLIAVSWHFPLELLHFTKFSG